MMKRTLLPLAIAASLLTAGAAHADPVFLLAQTNVTDAEVFFKKYGTAAFESLQKFGAKVHFGAQEFSAIEGDWDGNWTALVSFPTEKDALAWYNSDAYHEKARPFRLKSSDAGKLILFHPVSSE